MIDIVQIGANAGYTPEGEDIIWPIIRDKGWKAIFVEPMPEPFKRLIENYRDMDGHFFENVAILDYDGEATMCYEEFGDSRTASITDRHMPSNNTSRLVVPCMKIETLLEKYNMLDVPFHMLQMDIEGMDGRILRGTDFTRVLPRYIRFEHIYLGRYDPTQRFHVIDHLSLFGYRVVEDIYKDVFEAETNIDTMLERIK